MHTRQTEDYYVPEPGQGAGTGSRGGEEGEGARISRRVFKNAV